jgi:L-fuconate dehydratase
VVKGHYLLSEKPGYSTEIRPETLSTYTYPDGPVWSDR